MSLAGKLIDEAIDFAVKTTTKKAERASVAAAAKKAAGVAKSELAVPAEKVAKARAAKAAPTRPAGGMLAGAPHPHMVSTARPTPAQYKNFGNPDEKLILQTGDLLRASPGAFGRNMQMLTEEPFMHDLAGASPDVIASTAVRRGADNLNFIANEMMPPEKVDAAQYWYPVAHDMSGALATGHGRPAVAGHGMTAVTSPQTHWDVNMDRVRRILDMGADDFDYGSEEGLRNVRRWFDERSAMKPDKRGAIHPLGLRYAMDTLNTPMADLSDPFARYAKVGLTDIARGRPHLPLRAP